MARQRIPNAEYQRIARAFRDGGKSISELADEYGVHYQTIAGVIKKVGARRFHRYDAMMGHHAPKTKILSVEEVKARLLSRSAAPKPTAT